jgi:hypothetical protein
MGDEIKPADAVKMKFRVEELEKSVKELEKSCRALVRAVKAIEDSEGEEYIDAGTYMGVEF